MAAAAVILKGKTFQVQLADTPALHTRGLGGHKPLKAGEGMLFVYGQPSRYTFWMKGMGFPIDIIWIQNHTVVYIAHSIPPPPPPPPAPPPPPPTPPNQHT
ncbi:MAG: DUF192 domain-containing protein, partial [Deltaproteobacteria bacterium]|nr:DUF192 domain-containing protein [Deltaproteobacteria bacterium]